MSTPAVAPNEDFTRYDVGLPLRYAQRAFAALIEAGRTRVGAFRFAQLRSAARRTLSALSADDHARLQRWLSLQLASGAQPADATPLARVDAMLAAQVGGALARAREELSAHGAGASAGAR